MVECAVENQKPVRIGVNWGSLDQALLTRMMDANSRLADPLPARDVMMEAMVVSALDSAKAAERHGLRKDQIILSAKVSGVRDLIDVYTNLAARCDYVLHLGLTEAGMGSKGLIASTAGLAPLLLAGIGDTIRVSLTPKPNGDRTEEVQAAQQILQSLSIRSFHAPGHELPRLRAHHQPLIFKNWPSRFRATCAPPCPNGANSIPALRAEARRDGLRGQRPGESKHANLGISLPGTFEEPKAPVYIDGKLYKTLHGDTIVAEFKQILDNYVESHYGHDTRSKELVGTR